MDNNLTKIELENRYIKMYELYMEGKSYRELGVLFNISAERVRQVLHTRSSEDGLIELRRRIDNRCMNTWRSKEIC
jgi:DNA-directed RNA polymerase sigma subunit (sigma70/sigma32)